MVGCSVTGLVFICVVCGSGSDVVCLTGFVTGTFASGVGLFSVEDCELAFAASPSGVDGNRTPTVIGREEVTKSATRKGSKIKKDFPLVIIFFLRVTSLHTPLIKS